MANVARIIAVMNRKGGLSKTTTALCLTEQLRERGLRVLLVDIDQQHNSTTQYCAQSNGVATVFDLLTDRDIDVHECIQATPSGDIIAGDDWMNRAEEKMAGLDNREYMLLDGLRPVAGDYDFIIVDCPPNLGVVMKNVLVAADELIVPMLCDAYSQEAFAKLMEQVNAVRENPRLNPSLHVAGLLVTQYAPGRILSRKYDQELPALAEGFGTRLFDTRIRYCEKTRQAQEQGVSLFKYAPECSTAVDYKAFADELIGVLSGSETV